RQRLAEDLDGAAIRIGSALEAPQEGDVVLEREVNHAIRRGSGTPQAVEIVNGGALHLGPDGGEGGSRGIRASESDDLMACAEQLGNDGGADPAGCTGNENAHGNLQMVACPGHGLQNVRYSWLMSVTDITSVPDVSDCRQVLPSGILGA